MCFSTPTRCSVISNLSQTSVWSRRAPCTYAFPGLQRAGQWEESSEVKIESGIALWFLGRAQQEEAGPNITPTHIPVVSSLWRWFWISPGLGCNRDLKSEKRGCFWSSTRQPAGSTVNLKWKEVLFKFTHQTRLHKPTRLIIRFVCGFASFSVFIKLNQKKRKWCLHKTPTEPTVQLWGEVVTTINTN